MSEIKEIDWHAQCSKQSFLLGEIFGRVATIHHMKSYNDQTLAIDDLYCFLVNRLGELYYTKES